MTTTFYYYFLSGAIRRARAQEGTKLEARLGLLLGDEGDDKRDMPGGYFTTSESSKSDDIDLVYAILRGERILTDVSAREFYNSKKSPISHSSHTFYLLARTLYNIYRHQHCNKRILPYGFQFRRAPGATGVPGSR